MPKQRNSSFELIRILCIFFVVFWHSIGPYTNDLSTGNLVGSSFVNTLTNNTNLLFMMVSGYFGIRFNLEKLIKLDIAIIFYDLLHLFLFGEFGIKSLIIACMPITFKSHWFISYYFVITILSGFLNKIPEQLDRKSFRNLILLLLFLFYVIPTVFFYEIIEDAGKGVVCMTIMYLIGRYIRLHLNDLSFSQKKLAAVFFSVSILATVLNIILSLKKGVFTGMYCRDNSILIAVTAISFFLFFREMNFSSRIINHLSGDVVILYCIEGYARKFFWRYFDLAPYTKSPYFIGIVFVFAVVVFLFCILLNELRRLLFDRIDGALAALIMKPVNACTPALINGYRRAHDGMVQFLRKK